MSLAVLSGFALLCLIVLGVSLAGCSTYPMSRNTDVPGLVFDVTESQCGPFRAVRFMTISVSHGPGILNWFDKTDIAQYWGDPEQPITAVRIDKNRVRISFRAAKLFNHLDRWQETTFDYDVRLQESHFTPF
jgi:hypothetical protein